MIYDEINSGLIIDINSRLVSKELAWVLMNISSQYVLESDKCDITVTF